MNKRMAAICILFGLSFVVTTLLVGCNTVEGAGKDVKATGKAIEDAADTDD